MMWRVILGIALALVFSTGTALAQPGCEPGLLRQDDMAGVYTSFEAAMRVTVYPCGGIAVLWSNEYGTHEALYLGRERMPDGSILARLYQPDPYVRSLDGRNGFGLSPAEPGYVKLITIGPFGDNPRVYRLQKIA
jgi:hypothetical protein